MAHANFPNTGTKPRFVQYVKMNAIGEKIISQVKPWEGALKYMKDYFEPSELGKKLYGYEPWYQN